jgi:Sulfotransferase domain
MYHASYKAPVFNHDLSYWYRAYGLQLHDVPRAKVVIFGIPKSGNVWLQSLLCDALGLKPIDPMGQTDVSGVGMTHLPFCAAVADREDFLHGVCLVRDPRDVLASFYRYSKTSYFRIARLEFYYDDWDEFYYEWYLSRAVPAFDLLAHSDKYARLGVPVVRYERLRNDPAREVVRLLKRWGLEADEQAVASAVKENEISRLRTTGKSLNVQVPPSHFGSGRIGGFKSEIPPEILLDFEDRFSSLLSRWGYQPVATVGTNRRARREPAGPTPAFAELTLGTNANASRRP